MRNVSLIITINPGKRVKKKVVKYEDVHTRKMKDDNIPSTPTKL